jgi:hypothetical protein
MDRCKVLMENAQNSNMRRMLDGVAWELRQYQGEEGNVESCTHEVHRYVNQIISNNLHFTLFSVTEFL